MAAVRELGAVSGCRQPGCGVCWSTWLQLAVHAVQGCYGRTMNWAAGMFWDTVVRRSGMFLGGGGGAVRDAMPGVDRKR